MGNIVKILSEREKSGGYYEDKLRIEIEECIHIHYKDLRLFLTKEDFLKFIDIVNKAKDKYQELNCPEQTDELINLGEGFLSKGLSSNRIGIELQTDNSVHIHYGDLRVHVNISDFMVLFDIFHMASHNLPDNLIKEINIDKCQYHPYVNEHVKFLQEYENGSYREESDNVDKYKNEIIRCWSSVGDYKKRCLGLPDSYPGKVPLELDKKYLFALYESILSYGYAEQAFLRNYIIAYEYPDHIYITGSHRLACLKYLNYKNIKVYLMPPETGFKR